MSFSHFLIHASSTIIIIIITIAFTDLFLLLIAIYYWQVEI